MSHSASIECDYWWTQKGTRRNERIQFSCERFIDGMDFIETKRWARQDGWLLDMVVGEFTLKRDFCSDHARLWEEMAKDGLSRQAAPTKYVKEGVL